MIYFVKCRGRCWVVHYQDIEEVRAFQPDPDTFFYILTYNPEARRLANTQGEIRVGPSHQAKLPLLKSSTTNDESCSPREELLWKNKTTDLDLSVYLQAARSIAAFAGMCDRGLAEDMYEVAQRDDTTINALTVLHNHDYDCTNAIQALVKCPIPKNIDRKWSDEDQKKFLKGLRQYGKNFFRIRKEHLPHKQTSDLVEYYYLWKKTPQAQAARPRRRQRPCSTSANLSTTPTPSKQRNQKNHSKDESEQNSETDEHQSSNDIDEQLCRNCQNPTAKDLQIIGRDNHLLCSDCRILYKKYGDLPSMNPDSLPYLFKPLNDSVGKRKRTKTVQSPDENLSLSTRNKKKSRTNDKLVAVKQEPEDVDEKIKLEEQENEKPSRTRSSPTIKTEELNSSIVTPTPCKHELNSPKLPLDQTKQTNANLLLSSPSSAFSRTSKKSRISDENNGSIKRETSIDDDEGSISDCSTNTNQENLEDNGPAPLSCDREFYDKTQGIVLLKVYDRALSQNSCARTDIVLKRGSRRKPTEPIDSSVPLKQEDRISSNNNNKLPFSMDKMPQLLHSLPSFPHSDPLGINQSNSLFHPMPLHAALAANGPKPSLPFPNPFSLSPHDNPALRHMDPLSLRLMNPAQLFGNQSPFSPANLGRPTSHPTLDPATAAFLLDPRYRSLIPPFPNPSSSTLLPPISSSPSATNSPSTTTNGTHNHAHIHSHSHTHLHLGNTNDSSSPSASANNGGPSLLPPIPPPPPPHLLPFAAGKYRFSLENQFDLICSRPGLSHGNPLLHPAASLPPTSLNAIHSLARERELMSLMLASNNRFDPMTLALANSLQQVSCLVCSLLFFFCMREFRCHVMRISLE